MSTTPHAAPFPRRRRVPAIDLPTLRRPTAASQRPRRPLNASATTPRIAYWFEALVVVWLMIVYDAVKNLAPVTRSLALAHARDILSFERSLHVNVELTLNHWLASHSLLGSVAADYYDLGHFLVTFGVLGVLLWKYHDRYRWLRTQLVLITLIAFVVFWCYPVAPPRMLTGEGFVDIVARTRALVSFHSGSLAQDANQYAALPSLHVAWAMWSALAIWRMTSRRLVRLIAVAMPLLTALVVLSTGNHFVVDVAGGVATFALAGFAAAPALHLATALRRIPLTGAARGGGRVNRLLRRG
jgi:hypothetical protein